MRLTCAKCLTVVPRATTAAKPTNAPAKTRDRKAFASVALALESKLRIANEVAGLAAIGTFTGVIDS